MATINTRTGLPAQVDSNDPEELRRIINQLLAVIRTWNGEGAPAERLVTKAELDEATG